MTLKRCKSNEETLKTIKVSRVSSLSLIYKNPIFKKNIYDSAYSLSENF